MSLINRVLKDLEKRRAEGVNGPARLPQGVRASSRQPLRRLPPYSWLIGLALMLAGLLWWWTDRSGPAPPADVTQAPVPADASTERSVAQETVAPETSLPDPVPIGQETMQVPPAIAPDASAPEPAAVDAPAEEPVPFAEEAASATDEARVPSRSEVAPGHGLSPEREPEAVQPSAPGRIDKPLQSPETAARADQEFRRGMELFRGGRTDEAEAAWRAAVELDPAAAAPRQALLGALLERGERERAETLLQEGLRMNSRQPKQIMLLARLQLDRGAQTEALRTLEQGLPHAQWNAEYLSMTAAVMARVGRHRDAAELYASALRIVPGNAVWEMGRGMALRADGQREQALAAFQRASRLRGLSPELRAFVERQIRELQ